MKIDRAEYLLLQFAKRARWGLKFLGNRETEYFADKLAEHPIRSPIFVTGLARSGTTMMLELFAKQPCVATHRYRDFPMLNIPILWNRYLDRFPFNQEAIERPHQDSIEITRESPEGMEEPLWMEFFDWQHRVDRDPRIKASASHPKFEAFYDAHLRKILCLREGSRYVSKNNYHIVRLEYLAKLYPDAHFVIPIRHPVTHVDSLVRTHRKFVSYAAADSRFVPYLKEAGHFEFGPHRVPISIDLQGEKIQALWNEGNDPAGYAVQWGTLYGYLNQIRMNSRELSKRIHVVRYEDFCDEPEKHWSELLKKVDLFRSKSFDLQHLEKVAVSKAPSTSDTEEVWSITESIAKQFGYSRSATSPTSH